MNTGKNSDRVCRENDAISVEELLAFLPGSVTAGKIFLHATIDSTNAAAKKMADTRAEHGMVIIAEHQTAGRGRFGRRFHSPGARGIYMSLILSSARLGLSVPTLVTALAGVAVCEAVEAVCAKTPQIKWVNDVFLDGKKICGILTETAGEWLVVGIGINFSTAQKDFPEDLRGIAGAVFPDGKPPVSRNRLAGEVIGRVLTPPESKQALLQKYRQRLMMIGESIVVASAGQKYEATALDIDDIGRLIVRKPTGEVLSLSSGEVSIRKG